MDYGIAFPSYIDAWRDAAAAEAAGFTHAWFFDSQLIYSDVYATMALAAEHTSRIKLGTLVAIPRNALNKRRLSELRADWGRAVASMRWVWRRGGSVGSVLRVRLAACVGPSRGRAQSAPVQASCDSAINRLAKPSNRASRW